MDGFIELLVCAGALLGVGATYEFREGVMSLVRRARRRRDEREIARFARRNAGEFAEGEIARIVGRVRLGPKTLTAPFSLRPCCYYELIVRRCPEGMEGAHHGDEVSSTRQVVENLGSFREGCDFFVDGHGVNVRVALETEEGWRDDGARVHGIALAADHLRVHSVEKAPRFRAWFSRRTSRPLPAHFRVEECVLDEGAEVAVVGMAKWATVRPTPLDSTSGYRDASRALILQRPSASKAILVSGSPTARN